MPKAAVRLDVDTRKTMNALKGLEKQQFPFAYAMALTETARLARIAVQQRTRQVYDLHGEFIPRGILVENAKKADVKRGVGHSAVFTSRKITPFMARHETGGLKKPRGTALALPGEDIKKKKYKTATGRVRSRWRPSVLLAGYSSREARRQKQKGRISRKAFVLPAKGTNLPIIARRIRKGPRGLELLYILRKKGRIKPTWGFEDTVRRVVPTVFPKAFDASWRQALATAR